MFVALRNWLRGAAYASIQTDARRLIAHDERNAYYSAQRLAARSRFEGNAHEMLRWTRVAAEIAKTSSLAEMDLAVVKTIADEEAQP